MTLIIRHYAPGDENGMAEAHKQAVLKLCKKDYPEEICQQWAGNPSPQFYPTHMQNRGARYMVAEKNGDIAGFACWHGDEISRFYIHPDHAGKGVGRKLFQAIEAEYLNETGYQHMRIESTRTARPFYEKMGFDNRGHIMVTLANGTILPAYFMYKEYHHA